MTLPDGPRESEIRERDAKRVAAFIQKRQCAVSGTVSREFRVK